jgi:acylphosphatase
VIARRLVVHGRVQGVSYRDAMCDAARRAGVAGWVRNRRDGTVEALVQGEPDPVATIIAWCRRGPPAARVTAVDASDAPTDERIAGFVIAHSV